MFDQWAVSFIENHRVPCIINPRDPTNPVFKLKTKTKPKNPCSGKIKSELMCPQVGKEMGITFIY
jgi:hypothetical protein